MRWRLQSSSPPRLCHSRHMYPSVCPYTAPTCCVWAYFHVSASMFPLPKFCRFSLDRVDVAPASAPAAGNSPLGRTWAIYVPNTEEGGRQQCLRIHWPRLPSIRNTGRQWHRTRAVRALTWYSIRKHQNYTTKHRNYTRKHRVDRI